MIDAVRKISGVRMTQVPTIDSDSATNPVRSENVVVDVEKGNLIERPKSRPTSSTDILKKYSDVG